METIKKEMFKVVGKNIKKYRLEYGIRHNMKLSQEKLAEKVGVATSIIGNIERDNPKNALKVFTLYKICSELEVSIEKLFETEDNKPFNIKKNDD